MNKQPKRIKADYPNRKVAVFIDGKKMSEFGIDGTFLEVSIKVTEFVKPILKNGKKVTH